MGVIESAQAMSGLPYVFGGGRGDKSSCDCSSFVSDAFATQGVSIPAFTDAIAAATPLVGTDLSVAQPGDLLLYKYSDPSQPGTQFPHVAIFTGGGMTVACQYPQGSGAFPVLNLPFEVHRVSGMPSSSPGIFAGGNPAAGVVAWAKANPLMVGALAAAVFLLSGPLRNPSGGTWQPDLFGGAGKKREAGKDRVDELRRAREEMRDTGSRDLFDFLRPSPPPRRRPRRNIEAFTGAGGVIHPIRGSRGYDPEVDDVQRAVKIAGAQAERYRGLHRGLRHERDTSVDRPPWSAGYTNGQLERIARAHGTLASRENWWEEAGLYKGSGELRRLREAGYREEKTRKGAAGSQSRRATASHHRYKKPADLPF